MASLATLRLGVGSRLGTTIGASSIPTQTQVDAWLLEAAYKICDKADIMHLSKNFDADADSSIASGTASIDISGLTRYSRPVSLALNLDPSGDNQMIEAYRIPDNKIAPVSYSNANTPFYEGALTSPVWWIKGSEIEFSPAAAANNSVSYFIYVQYPADASGMEDKFANIMIDYTTMMAELQDEELVDAQIFGQVFEKNWGSYRGL